MDSLGYVYIVASKDTVRAALNAEGLQAIPYIVERPEMDQTGYAIIFTPNLQAAEKDLSARWPVILRFNIDSISEIRAITALEPSNPSGKFLAISNQRFSIPAVELEFRCFRPADGASRNDEVTWKNLSDEGHAAFRYCH
ncbi:hypothetical protein GCM10019059_35820 [Camelimonas fluminis]|uniref:Uncharacterized protein n=1 Tax=Camelimonas fluminis TaxID=1576911 RepID=A0ABV7UF41_9HYPH|nr:hypothetical protein [Camelimonas fluminis]GHE73031.1 hypothetical protein GCM10019059_35820 [Camelimonas fluminis]